MAPRSAEGAPSSDRERERQKFKARLATALTEDDDPLAVYHQFVQWTIKNYGENDPKSGLKDLLKAATSQFKDDPLYKTDLRYLKMWALHGRQMDRSNAMAMYASLMSNDIGTSYSALYEDYANLLEDDGKRQEADTIYRKGIKKNARPLERLKTRYKEFQSRGSSAASASSAPPTISSTSRTGSSKSQPLSSSASKPSSSSVPTTTSAFNSTAASRYALMLAPPPPGKRAEKLRFKMGLLFTEEGVEYSIQEARARSMGLLGKKWGPPPPSELARSSVSTASSSSTALVDFNDDGRKGPRMKSSSRRSLLAEPTVTINTKEALADVFGMYNSPDKTSKLAVPGSKHAPVKKIEPVTPMVAPKITFARENDNSNSQNAKTPIPAFRPFTDENAQPSTRTPGVKFLPFTDPEQQQKTPFTPRPALSVKDPSPPTNPATLSVKSEEKNPDPVFSKVFTPANKSVPLAPLRDVFTDDHGKPLPKPKAHTHERSRSQDMLISSAGGEPPKPNAFTPFKDENARTPFKVFSRPPETEEPLNPFTPKAPAAFTPFVDSKPSAFTPFRDVTPAFKPFADSEPATAPTPRQAFQPLQPIQSRDRATTPPEEVEEEVQGDLSVISERHIDQDEDDYSNSYEDEEESPMEQYDVPLVPEHIPGESEYEEGDSYHEIPLGGRFGQFNVMTPITERTIEFTSTTRMGETPSGYGSMGPRQAAILAEQLAAELRKGEESEEDDPDTEGRRIEPLRLSVTHIAEKDTEIAVVEEKAGSLSLVDALTLGSKFKPSNPCNPFDPAVLSALISRIPTDPHFIDLRGEEIGMLAELEKFVKKNKNCGSFALRLQGHKFLVTEKLGEGGFGSVFKARDVGMAMDGADEDDEDEDDDDDDENASMIALKVVKPRNLWEYHVLRRLHSTLPPSLRRSLVLPHALYAFKDESYLVLDLCSQGMLLSVINNAVSAGVAQAGACLDELLVIFFSIELLRLTEAMHTAGFIHGDLKIDNCLLRLEEVPGGAAAWSGTYSPSGEGGWCYKGLKVIDFGRTIHTRMFPSGQQFIADWPADERDCFEIRQNKPWTYQADYFGLAGIIYCMLFGKYIQSSAVTTFIGDDGVERRKIATPLKRYWQTDIWNQLFDILLNSTLVKPNGELPICNTLEASRKEMEKWLQSNCNRTSNTLKGLLKKVELSCYKS